MKKWGYILLAILVLMFYTRNLGLNSKAINYPSSIDMLVNKSNKLDKNYEPNDLIELPLKYSNSNKYLRKEAATNFYKLSEKVLNRQMSQGGCAKAYQLTQDDYNFAFAAQELGYTYTQVANYLEIKPATVKDWFNGRSRKKNKEIYLQLTPEEKNQFLGRVKTAELSGNPKSESSN